MLTPNQAAALRTLLDTGAAPQDAVVRKALVDSGAAEFAGVLFRPTAAAERVLAEGEAEYASGLAKFAARFAQEADKAFDNEHGKISRRTRRTCCASSTKR